MKVPWSDLRYSQEEIDAVTEVLKSGWPSRGKVTEEFESELGKYLNSNVLVVNNCSSALMCALLANGIKPNDVVVVPDFTFIATASVPALLGCKVELMDVDRLTYIVKSASYWSLPEMPFKAMIVTDVAGLPVDIFTKEPLIEDAAEAFGAETTRWKVGGGDHLTCFSFQATKNLSTIEGGAIASRDEEMIAKCRKIADYGRTEEHYRHGVFGTNMRITDVQSAIGRIQLRKIDSVLARRKEITDRYVKEIECVPQFIDSYVLTHANWMFLAYGLRDREKAFLDAGVDVRRPFIPIHMQPCFPQFQYGFFPNASWIYTNALSLPIFNSMTDEQVDYVVEVANR